MIVYVDNQSVSAIVNASKAMKPKTRAKHTMSTTYTIHESSSGAVLARITVDDTTEIETLSSDTAEGHFRAGKCDDVVSAGVSPDLSVYAIIH